ncbi:MAG TPA: GTP 3',8-cyclase MoaA [Terriglobia bacterium]|nr:GTP 3',8-cyclase MoaA [Terriglobia bacterium]
MPTVEVARSTPILDALGRPLRSLRISVTDRCNMRCAYCMPEEEYIWLEHREILSFEEIAELTGIFTDLGVDRVRLTGGEPLLRRDLHQLIRLLAQNARIHDLALTTNGVLLRRDAHALRDAGLQRLTVSLDTLKPERFRPLTRSDAHAQVLDGIRQAQAAGFGRLKINTVVIRGFNDDELAAMIDFGRQVGGEVRFIEYMDVGGATRWSLDQVVPRAEILASFQRHFGRVEPVEETAETLPTGAAANNGSVHAKAPADRFRLPDGTVFGIISSTTQPFCRSCDRARLTPDGVWLLCLYARDGVNLKHLLRGGASREAIAQTIAEVWQKRVDRGAEQRLTLASRGALFAIEDLRLDPHREMHTRGG